MASPWDIEPIWFPYPFSVTVGPQPSSSQDSVRTPLFSI